MDLLAITRKFWRYKLLTVPVVILTLWGAVYVMAVKQPVYEATSSYVLLNPPAPPTAEDIVREPALARVKSDNPYTRFGDQSVILAVLTSTLSGDSAREALVKAGADNRYTVAPSTEFGYSSPIVQVSAAGADPATAMRTAKIVGDALTRELGRMQEAQGVDERYRIKALPVAKPDEAQLQASGKLRMLVGVLLLGALGLFIVVSVVDAVATLRRERRPVVAMGGSLEDLWEADARRSGEPWDLGPEPHGSAYDVDAISTNGRARADQPYPDERERSDS
jgi:hypothetical protein